MFGGLGIDKLLVVHDQVNTGLGRSTHRGGAHDAKAWDKMISTGPRPHPNLSKKMLDLAWRRLGVFGAMLYCYVNLTLIQKQACSTDLSTITFKI